MSIALRVAIADDERPARSFLRATLASFDDVSVVAEAESGLEAVAMIERTKPDLALLDFEMPELNGLQVVGALRGHTPLVAFVTAFDEHAVKAFDLNAIDYLLKPVEPKRLRETLNRAIERVERNDLAEQPERWRTAADTYQAFARPTLIERIPVRRREEVVLVPVAQIVSIVAEGELLHLTTLKNERFTIAYRLKDLEGRLDTQQFVRLGRGILARVDAISKVNFMPGGSQVALLTNGQKLPISRIQSRILKERLLRL
jgi:DNA-binding LytR/AlgR family response regulator